MGCLYVSQALEEAERWGEFFARLGRPAYQIVKLEIHDSCFPGDAAKCFDGRLDKREHLRLARLYWENEHGDTAPPPVWEMLVDGRITVVEIVKEISANLEE